MTEDIEDRESAENLSGSDDDSRFEVKWRKKDTASSSPPAQPQSEPSAENEATEDAGALRQQLQSEQERVRNLQDKWQRAAADLANLRRRTEQEKGDVEKFASMLLVQQLLPVLDNFDRALNTIPGNLQMLTWIQGVMLIERHFRAILDQQGLQTIEAVGQPFDARFHEAIGERETSEAPAETVLQEYQRGYTMHGQVIRPALVEVAKAPHAPPEEGTTITGESGDPSTVEGVVVENDNPPSAPSPPPNEETSTIEGEEIAEQAETENTGP